MVGDICLDSPLRCSLPGDRVRGLMGAGRRRGELLVRRREELMAGLLSEDCSWLQVLRDAWMDGLLSDEDRPGGTGTCVINIRNHETPPPPYTHTHRQKLRPPCELPRPRCIMAAGRFPVLLPPLRLGKVAWSSGSSGVESGEGKWRLVRSGREPPEFNKPW